MKKLYLDVADLRIQLNFYPAEGTFFCNKLIRDIKHTYKAFLSNIVRKTDYHIDFYQNHNRQIFSKKIGKMYNFFVDFCKVVNKKRIISYYKISLVQFQFILSNILQDYLATHEGFILHASGVYYGRKAFLFTGRPGSGKSTVMKLLSNIYFPLADDSVIIKKNTNTFYCYQTPFIETNDWRKTKIIPLDISGIFFLKKAKIYAIEEITDVDYILNRLSKQLLIQEKNMPHQIKHLLFFIKTNKFYYLQFGKNKKKISELFKRSFL
jgi:hypothetical protein